MATRNFQVACAEEQLAELVQFMQTREGSTQAEKLAEVFRLAQKGALEEEGPIHAQTMVFRRNMDAALKAFDGMAAQVAELPTMITEAVEEKTAKIQAELEAQTARISEAEEIIRRKAETDRQIAELQTALATAQDQNALYKEKLAQTELDEARLAELEEIAATQARELEQARLDIAVQAKDAENKAELANMQKTRIAALEQEVQKEREQAKTAMQEQETRIRQECEAKLAAMETARQQEQEKAQAEREASEERIRTESEEKITALKDADSALIASLRERIEAQQSQIKAMLTTKEKPQKKSAPTPASAASD